MNRHSPYFAPYFALYLTGLGVTCWIGAGYVVTNPLGALVTGVIAACYLAGGIELHRYRQATATLSAALQEMPAAGGMLDAWLARLHPGLRNAVRLRIEGERVALPAPALTPYLVGLLVLLGMLGTLMGMMATLRGTGLALESATDLDAIRGSLAAPIKGLAFAFGTSIAGVASSAVLGLLSALCRRERLQAVQQLDVEIATSLRVHSQAWQREEAFRLLQQQATVVPALVEQLQAMVGAIERQGVANGDRLAAHQAEFHARTESAYAQLAHSLEQSMRAGAAESTRAAAAVLQPAIETTMAGLSRETAVLHDTVNQAVQRQLEALTAGVDATREAAAAAWTTALEGQRGASEAQGRELEAALTRFASTFEQRSVDLVEGVSQRLDATAGHVAAAWQQALAQQDAAGAALASRNEQALANAATTFERHADALISRLAQSHDELQAALAGQDQQRLEAWTGQLSATGVALREEWEHAGAHTAARQQEICDALASSAADITAQAQAHARETIAEISRLVQVASEAPRAAAEVIAELRQKLSDSMVRDTAMLEERNQMLATLDTLLAAVNHASTEQRGAIDALVATSADLLDRVGNRFADQVEAGTGKLEEVAAQVAAGATEVASLSDAFGMAVERFGASNDILVERLGAIEGALDRSLVRSDEQLAYYVAQAREVIDLSLLAQKQIMADLQRIGGQPSAGAHAA
ncbi:DUF802 domain-containing protein [Pseudoxanthomonas daejeonensis]|uniref:DUF802 domain-containing protein n=1 Tax=Pseudoxanthomonas daejeonensis TaxID=266062 RepID=UPI001F547DCC|nr:DUF802 domain-containing protein [Pseudoxanthomonas daejeonensis]UNK58342.1 DUF802 domain-containing protein [Pseudoxanthomonas daejeonensis]